MLTFICMGPALTCTNDQGLTKLNGSIIFYVQCQLALLLISLKYKQVVSTGRNGYNFVFSDIYSKVNSSTLFTNYYLHRMTNTTVD